MKAIIVFGAPWQDRNERSNPSQSRPTMIFELEDIPKQPDVMDGWLGEDGLDALLGEMII